jgi:hypothetical protein
MKILASILLALALSLVSFAQSQDQNTSQSSQTDQSGQAGQANQSQGANGNQNMSGKVSHDGQTVKNDQNGKNYKVDNPNTLQGKQDQHVALIVHVDPDNNVIHVIEVAPPQ